MQKLLSLFDTELFECLNANHEKAFEVLLQCYVKDLRNVIQ